MQAETFDSWALVELMGHQRIAGRVTEAEIGGCKFIRVDVPGTDERQPLTKYLGPSSIYAITPLSEETARETARRIHPEPISAWDARLLAQEADKRSTVRQLSDGDTEDEDEADEFPI